MQKQTLLILVLALALLFAIADPAYEFVSKFLGSTPSKEKITFIDSVYIKPKDARWDKQFGPFVAVIAFKGKNYMVHSNGDMIEID